MSVDFSNLHRASAFILCSCHPLLSLLTTHKVYRNAYLVSESTPLWNPPQTFKPNIVQHFSDHRVTISEKPQQALPLQEHFPFCLFFFLMVKNSKVWTPPALHPDTCYLHQGGGQHRHRAVKCSSLQTPTSAPAQTQQPTDGQHVGANEKAQSGGQAVLTARAQALCITWKD